MRRRIIQQESSTVVVPDVGQGTEESQKREDEEEQEEGGHTREESFFSQKLAPPQQHDEEPKLSQQEPEHQESSQALPQETATAKTVEETKQEEEEGEEKNLLRTSSGRKVVPPSTIAPPVTAAKPAGGTIARGRGKGPISSLGRKPPALPTKPRTTKPAKKESDEEEEAEEEEEEEEDEGDDTSDESWSGQESESTSEEDDNDEDWSEEEERKNKKRRPTPARASGGGRQQASSAAASMRGRGRVAQSQPVFPPRAVLITPSHYAFEFDIQSEFNMYTVDVVVGNFVNALEGACESQGTASSLTWLSEVPPPNYSSGTIIVRPVSMRIPAMAGRWMAGHFISNLGCCGVMFWHTLYVGPNPQAAVDLIKDFARSGMEIFENNEKEVLRNKGLRLIGRYSWDYYRQYGGGGYRIPQLTSTLFGGPHCFFLPAEEYRNKVYPDILTRVSEFDNGAPDARFQPFLNRINHNGALGVFPNQEYMFAKVFLQPDSYTNRTRWVGVRAMLLYTYNVGETWADCRVENVPIDIQTPIMPSPS